MLSNKKKNSIKLSQKSLENEKCIGEFRRGLGTGTRKWLQGWLRVRVYPTIKTTAEYHLVGLTFVEMTKKSLA